MIGFFSFTEVTDGAHRAYNEWHQFDHMPEQFTLDGVCFGRRWVCTPDCRRAMVAVSPLLASCHYMTLYLMRDRAVIPSFFALATRLREEGRFFAERVAHLSGRFPVSAMATASRLVVSPGALPFRPSHGIYVVVGPPAPFLSEVDGVAGAWTFADDERHITVAFVDGDLLPTAAAVGPQLRGLSGIEWAGPLEEVMPGHYSWFGAATSQ